MTSRTGAGVGTGARATGATRTTGANGLAAGYIALFALLAFGLFSNLDDRRLWGDEAETAALAVNITRFGLPQVDDGRNVIANRPERGDSNEAGIWTWSPWLDEYCAAASFLLLGPTTLSARLPFALLALCSAFLLARLAYRSTHRHAIALMALTLYATCVPLLLHARQSRYYAVLMLAELWLLHGLMSCLERGNVERKPADRASHPAWIGALHVALALTALFYCNYLVVPGNLIALAGVATLIWIREGRPPLALAAAAAGFAALATPWLLYASPARHLGEPGGLGGLGLQHFWPSLSYYASELHFHFVPWIVLALPIAGFVARKLRPQPSRTRPSRDLETFVWFLLVASLLFYAVTPLRFFRYLIPLGPALILLAAILIHAHIRPTWARVALVALLAGSNIIAIASAPPGGSHRPALPYLDFARSITSEYHERLDDVLAFLEAEAQPGQSIWVADPEFPLQFYTDLRIIDARYHRFPDPPPDWIFATSASGLANSAKRRPLQPPSQAKDLYGETTLRVRRSPSGGSRPDPHAHASFETGPAETERMRIYKKH